MAGNNVRVRYSSPILMGGNSVGYTKSLAYPYAKSLIYNIIIIVMARNSVRVL
jgi:hypothetical protein